MEEVAVRERVCVTGAGGYVASWVVKFLLSKGYTVHGTVRDPSDEKNAHLKKLEKATENLKLFKADLLDYDSLSAAIAGCEGVFHVASPVPSSKVPNPEVDLITPAVTGTLNVLKACSEAKVKRVVVVSSIVAVTSNPNWPRDTVMDENCWSDKEFCKTSEVAMDKDVITVEVFGPKHYQHPFNQKWYCLSKTLAEGEALDYAKKHGLDVVTVLPSWVIGPLLQSTVNASSLIILSLLKGDRESIENRFRHFVDVRDVADAVLLAYKNPEASGRYICAPHLISTSDMVDILKSIYPNYNYPKEFTEVENDNFRGLLTSEKLKKLGWKYRTLKESLIDSVEYYQEAGLLNKD